jgi:hypothetical protein
MIEETNNRTPTRTGERNAARADAIGNRTRSTQQRSAPIRPVLQQPARAWALGAISYRGFLFRRSNDDGLILQENSDLNPSVCDGLRTFRPSSANDFTQLVACVPHLPVQ